MASKYTPEEIAAAMKTSRDLLASPPPPYEPAPDEPLFRRHHDRPHEREPRPERMTDAVMQRMANAATPQGVDWSAWESWISTRIADAIAAEREAILAAVVEVVGESLGTVLAKALDDERATWQREIGELSREAAKLNSAVEELHGLLSAERAKTVIDLPPLPLRPNVN